MECMIGRNDLLGPIDDTDGVLGFDLFVFEDSEHFYTGADAKNAVLLWISCSKSLRCRLKSAYVATSGWLSIQM